MASDQADGQRHDILIRGGTLLSMVEGEAPLEKATIVIQGDCITQIMQGDCPSPHDAEIIDARHGIIMPGLVNEQNESHSRYVLHRHDPVQGICR